MIDRASDTTGARRGSLAQQLLRDRTFLIAACVLTVAAVTWPTAVWALGWSLTKYPVPWTEETEVGPGFRNTAFPIKIGPYVLMGSQYDDLHGGLTNENGDPYGYRPYKDEELELLKIGTPIDQANLSSRTSNWYVSRVYRDSRFVDPKDPRQYWRLTIEYYTGGHDVVPHIPDVCLVQGGARLVERTTIGVRAEDVHPAWSGELRVNKIAYDAYEPKTGQTERLAQYYTFSMNGRPEPRREWVRWELTKPWVAYCYFAKIQFAPMFHADDKASVDAQAKEFFRTILPAVLEHMPKPEDVAALSQAE
jgi:hypothetical protein